jgi:hypothetical protein
MIAAATIAPASIAVASEADIPLVAEIWVCPRGVYIGPESVPLELSEIGCAPVLRPDHVLLVPADAGLWPVPIIGAYVASLTDASGVVRPDSSVTADPPDSNVPCPDDDSVTCFRPPNVIGWAGPGDDGATTVPMGPTRIDFESNLAGHDLLFADGFTVIDLGEDYNTVWLDVALDADAGRVEVDTTDVDFVHLRIAFTPAQPAASASATATATVVPTLPRTSSADVASTGTSGTGVGAALGLRGSARRAGGLAAAGARRRLGRP